MKVLYNAIQLIPPLTGIGVYSRHIAEQVALLDGVEEVQFFFGGQCGQLEELFESAPALASGRKRPLPKKIQRALLLKYSLGEILNGVYHYIPILNGPVTRALEQLESRQRTDCTKEYLYHETNFVLKPECAFLCASLVE